MKRFLTGVFILLVLLLGLRYAIYSAGFYLDLSPGAPVEVPFRCEGSRLLRETGDGAPEPLILRGVVVTSSLAGTAATQYAARKEDYLRWFGWIGEMGANAVRTVTVMDDDFYNALYEYNTTQDEPLYLLQGTNVPDAVLNGPNDAYDSAFLGSLIQDGKDLVDIIHGRKNILVGELRGSGTYRRDLSPWVAGFLVGNEFPADTVAYTDHSVLRSGAFEGDYFTTAQDATPFEAMLARVMEEITAYETKKYKTQRPVGIACDPSVDFLEYEPVYARQLVKFAQIDAEHILPTPACQSGRFVAYRLYDYCERFAEYLSGEQRQRLGDILPTIGGGVYGGYLPLVAQYHSMPVLAAEFGFSSARGAVKIGALPLTEREQGERLAQVSRELETAGWSGGFVSTWQDTWERRTWNTAFATVPTRNELWHDLQSDGQGYGLMAFDPGKEERACLVDGDPSEWAKRDRVAESGGRTLSAKYDAQGLYLLAEGADVTPHKRLYIPLDLSPEAGSFRSAEPGVSFDRAADFLLCLAGEGESRLLVQERQDAMRENFLFETVGENPFVKYPAKDSAAFVPVTMVLSNPLLLDVVTPQTRVLQRLGVWETGKLRHGVGNPASPEYDSLADFCYGDGCVEVRLPWLLLNVADPSQMRIHRDYYERYGVDTRSITRCYLGIGEGGEIAEGGEIGEGGEIAEGDEIALAPYRLRGWNLRVDTHERLKESYQVLKALWKEEASVAVGRP